MGPHEIRLPTATDLGPDPELLGIRFEQIMKTKERREL